MRRGREPREEQRGSGSPWIRPLPGHIFVFRHKGQGPCRTNVGFGQGGSGAPPGSRAAGGMASAMAGGEQAAGPGVPPGARGEAAREVLALRNLVAVYRHLSGLAVQDADLAAVTRLIAEQTGATVAIVSPT